MKKTLKRIVSILILFLIVLFTTSCKDDAVTTTTLKGDDSIPQSFYLGSEKIDFSDISISVSEPVEIENDGQYDLTIKIRITNRKGEHINFEITKATLINEKLSFAQEVSFERDVELYTDQTKELVFSATTSSSITSENYKLYFEMNPYKITYFLYNVPDNLRVDRRVNYYIDDKIVYTETIKDDRSFDEIYSYETDDNEYHCNKWYFDTEKTKKLDIFTHITEDTNLYGELESNIEWSFSSSDTYAKIKSINYIPKNGIVVIPDKYKNKNIAILASAISNLYADSIYIPKSVKQIYIGNFSNIGNTKIYYEGTESEWKSIFIVSSSVVTKNVTYNTKFE